jgi:hypothetical protein
MVGRKVTVGTRVGYAERRRQRKKVPAVTFFPIHGRVHSLFVYDAGAGVYTPGLEAI